MLETPRMGLPYPERPDTVDVPRDIHALALGVESHSHICLLERTVVQSFAPQFVTFPTVVYDPDSMYVSSGTRNGWVVLPFPGIWQASAYVQFDNRPDTATCHKYMLLAVEGVGPSYTPLGAYGEVQAEASSSSPLVNSGDLPLSTSAIFRVNTAGESVGLLTVSVGGSSNTTIDPTDINQARLAVSCLRNLS